MKALNWVAIGMGVAVCIAAWAVIMVMGMMMPMTAASAASGQVWLNRSIGLGSRFAGGFAAGWMSGERGAQHGVIVGVVAAVLTNSLSIGLTLMRSSVSLGMLPASYWGTVLMWALVGIALAGAGGYVGATPHFRAGHAKGE